MNGMYKKVSVIIPTYGGGGGLDRTIDSILNQTYNNIEVIIVDDNGLGSDNQKKTESVLAKYQTIDRVKYITPEKNGGGSVARNIGAKSSSGEYLMFLDDDDTVSEDKIERQVEALENGNGTYGLAYCSTKVYLGDQFSNIITATQSGDILEKYLFGKIYIGTGTALLIREAWESIGGYDESFARHQDWEFFARVLNKYHAIAVDGTYFHRYIVNRNLPKRLDVLDKNMEHYISFLKEYPFRLSSKTMRKVVNLNNSKTALICLKKKEYKLFREVMRRHDNLLGAYVAFFEFTFCALFDKLRGKKS